MALKVAMWSSWQTRCGIASYTAELVAALQTQGVAVDVVPVPYADRSPETLERTLARLNAADLIHLQHEYTFFGGIAPGSSSLPRYLAGLRKPLVVTAHTVFTAAELLRVEHETRPRQKLAKKVLAALPRYRRSVERDPFATAAAIIVHTEAARARLQTWRLKNLHVLPAGIPTPQAATESEISAFRERLRLPPGKLLTIFGFITPDKGYETALAALGKLPSSVNLVIAGGTRVETEAPYLERLRAEIERRGLASRVAMTGFLEEREIAAAMAVSDLVLAPHLAANGSYSVLIALSYGKAVIASDLACFHELKERHSCIELFAPEDETELAERIGFLLATASTRRTLIENARRFTAEQTWDAVAAQTVAVYQQCRPQNSGP